MKKVRKAAAVAAVMAALLSACGSLTGKGVDSGEIVVPEMSSEDLLVSSLELLLQDEEVPKEVQDLSEEEPEVTRNTEEQAEEQEDREESQNEQERVPAENEAVIFYGEAGSYDLSREIIPIEDKTAEELVDALARHNIMSLDTKVLSFEEKEDAGEKILHLDLSKAAGEYLKTMSREAECIILASVINTFLENYEADGVCIAVNGRPLTTKNAEYTNVLKRCTPEELLERISQEETPEENGQAEVPEETGQGETPEENRQAEASEVNGQAGASEENGRKASEEKQEEGEYGKGQ